MTMLRSMIFEAYQAFVLIIIGIVALPMMIFGRSAALWASKLWVKTNLAGLRIITGVKCKIVAPDNIPEQGCIVACNHQSMWETLALYALLPKPVMIFKQELLRVPIFGWWLGAAGNIAINRKGGAKALRAMQAKAKKAVDAGGQVVVFPEGTRVKPGETARFQPGIAGIYASTGASCVPVAHNSGLYWRYPGVLKKSGTIEIRFGDPIAPGHDRREFLGLLKRTIDASRPDLDGTLQSVFDHE